jgi:biotin carboxylase
VIGGGAEAAGHFPRKDVVVVNTSKADPVTMIERDARLKVVVVTEARYSGLYRDDTTKVIVNDVSNCSEVCAAVVAATPPSGRFEHVIALSERSVASAGYVRSFLGIPGAPFDVANAFTNKYVMKRRLQAAGIPVSPFQLVLGPADIERAAGLVGWPIIIKPVLSSGAVNAIVAHAPEDLQTPECSTKLMQLMNPRRAGDRTYPLVLERFQTVERESHCDGVVAGGEVAFCAISHYVMPALESIGAVFGSYPLAPNTKEWQQIEAMHREAVSCLGLESGVTHMEALQTPDGLMVGEIACRPPGLGIVRHVELLYGVNLWRAYLQTALNEVPDLVAGTPGERILECSLPAKRGRIVQLTDADEFWSIPETVEVRMDYRRGDEIAGVVDAARAVGIVYLRAPSETDVQRLMRAVGDRYRLAVE